MYIYKVSVKVCSERKKIAVLNFKSNFPRSLTDNYYTVIFLQIISHTQLCCLPESTAKHCAIQNDPLYFAHIVFTEGLIFLIQLCSKAWCNL